MEGKNVIMSVLLVVSLVIVLGQIQVEAQALADEACCPSDIAKNHYLLCRVFAKLATIELCLTSSGCIARTTGTCPPGWTNDMLENTSVNEYCKSGCVSSLCGAITTLQNSDASEVVNEAVEKCTNACSDFCTNKGSIKAA